MPSGALTLTSITDASGYSGAFLSYLTDNSSGTQALSPTDANSEIKIAVALPASFASFNSITVTVLAAMWAPGTDDLWSFGCRIYDGTTQISTVTKNYWTDQASPTGGGGAVFSVTFSAAELTTTTPTDLRIGFPATRTGVKSADGKYVQLTEVDVSADYNSTGKFGSASGSLALAGVAAGRNLSAPTGLTATPVSGDQIDVSWNPVSGATGYDIERDGLVVATNHPSTTYSDSGLAAGTQYGYRVRSRRAS